VAAKPCSTNFANDGFALEVLIAGKGERFSHPLPWIDRLLLALRAFPRGAYHGIRLVAKVRRQLAMGGHHLGGRVNLLAVAGGVRGNLSGLLSCASRAFQILTNLLAARTRCVKVFLTIPFDFRSATPPGGDLITQLPYAVGQLRLVDGGGELLLREQALRLNGARLATLSLRYVEDDRVGMQLRSDIAIDRTRGVVLKLCHDEFARRFG